MTEQELQLQECIDHIRSLEKAIVIADDTLGTSEGVGLLYYIDDVWSDRWSDKERKQAKQLISEALEKKV